MNVIEKYLAKAAGLQVVKQGQDIRCKVDLVAAHDVTGPMAIQQFKEIGIQSVFDPTKVVMVIDHIFPAATVNARNMHWILQEFARRYGTTLYDKGQGVIHQVISEKHRLNPGSLLICADSHTCTAGGYGVIGIGVGSTELAAAMATGTIDLEVPEVIEVYLTGAMRQYISGKDLVLTLTGIFKTDGLVDKALLITGPGIACLETAERMTVCNMGIEMGAMITLFGTEEKAQDAAQTYEIKLEDIVPMLACPPSPDKVTPVENLMGTPVTQVVVGSCTNGRLNDIEVVVRILKGRKVHPAVNMLVVPASREILEQMDKRGWSTLLREAGAVVTNPGCGPCFGAHMGLINEKDVVVSTTNRNFPGRMGERQGKIYLASPATAAETAVLGHITSPGTLQATEVI